VRLTGLFHGFMPIVTASRLLLDPALSDALSF
jgi:hypothetical protein